MLSILRRLNRVPRGKPDVWSDEHQQARLIATNVAFQYLTIGVEIVLGAAMLPFNVHHLGRSAYGLWVLVTSLTTYFSMLDLGYGSAQVKFAAQYRAKRDARALNEIASTLFFLFVAIAGVAYVIAIAISVNLGHIFRLTPDQLAIGRKVFLIVTVYVALGLPFSVFGGIVNGFQRFYQNNVIAVSTSVLATIANILVLSMGYGIVELVACTTSIRLLSLLAYRRSAYSAFPMLSIRWAHVRRARLHEVTSFSVFLLLIDIAGKINYSSDTVVIGAVMGPAAIAVWAVAARLVDITRMVTQIFSRLLFPTMVDSSTRNRLDQLRVLLVEGTRVSLATALPMATVTAIVAEPLVRAWVGPQFGGSVPVIWMLSIAVTVRMGTTTSRALLQGCGLHRLLAWQLIAFSVTNLLLSIVFARMFGLPGVALGTLIPLTFVSLFVFVPAACRRAELPLWTFVRTAVWPTVWPMAPVGAALWMMRDGIGIHLWSIGLAAVAAGAAYGVIVVSLALDGKTRDWYIRKLTAVLRDTRTIGAPATT
jgi:O-antigen/teichoic acid export membrane protein